MADHSEPSPDATLGKSQASPNRRKSDPFSDWEAFKESKVEISVSNPIMKEEMFAKYFVYKIQGTDFKGYFELSRRYSDFEKIRQLLVIRWPGCFIPSLPAKQINNMGKDVVDDRKKHLDNFCKRVAEIPHLHYSDVYQVFLRSKMVDLDPLLTKYQKVAYEDIIARYTKAFAHLSGKDVNSDAQFKITNFGAFLQKSTAQFEKYKKVAKKYVTARKEFTATFVEMHGMMANEYEKNVFSEYHGKNPDKNVFLDPTVNKMNDNVEQVRQYQSQEVVDKLYEWIKAEARDIEAFSEAFAQRDKYVEAKNKMENKNRSETKDLQNMAAGKTTFKSLFTSGKKEQNLAKLEDKVSGTGKDLENLGLIQEMITLLLAYEEIDKFRTQRLERYYKLVGETSKFEIDTFSTVLSYWRDMLENPNVKAAMEN